MRDMPFQQSIYHASADFAHRRMTHRSPHLREARYGGRRKVGIGGYGFGGPRACPWGSMRRRAFLTYSDSVHKATTLKFVYLLQSISHPDQRYVGITSNVEKRLTAHNEGRSPHTAKFKPWKLVTYLAFTNSDKAQEFERYLKSGSGHAFAKRHFWA